MTYRAVFHPLAVQDLEDIDEYLSQFSDNTAPKFFKAFTQKLSSLSDNPRIFAVWNDNPAYRRFVLGNYLAFYQILDDSRTVTICRVIDSRRDVKPSDISPF